MSPHGSLRTLHLASICKPSTHRNHVFPNIITFQKKKKKKDSKLQILKTNF